MSYISRIARLALRPCSALAIVALAGTLAQAANAQETTDYKYDALGRLIEVKVTGGFNDGVKTETTFDKAGNRSNVKVTGARGRVVVVPLNGLTVIPIQ